VIFFDVRLDNQPASTVSIRKLANGVTAQLAKNDEPVTNDVYAYEISTGKKTRHRGTVTHQGSEDFRLISTVLNDYVSSNGR
jgi:hypothetical protein